MGELISRFRGPLIGLVVGGGIIALLIMESGGPVAEGMQVPSFSASILDNERRLSHSDFAGQPVLLDFWATWCTPCRTSMPALDQLSQEYEGRVQFYAVNAQNESRKLLRKFRDELKLSLPIVTNANPLMHSFRVERLPTTVLLDASGKVAFSHSGVVDNRVLRREIDRALAKVEAPLSAE